MHRTIQLTVKPEATTALCDDLRQVEEVMGLSVQCGASIKPPGDVITVHVLNTGTDSVLQLVKAAERFGSISVVTAEVTSIIDPERQGRIDGDRDEAIWEEMEAGLRHQGQVTPNFIALMALGGGIAAAAQVLDTGPQVIAVVGASIIAPGFEPFVKVPLGAVLRRWVVVRRGIIASLVGYAVLIAAAAVVFLGLRMIGATTVEEFVTNPGVEHLIHPKPMDHVVSACGAAAGVIMVAAFRRSVIAGPLIVMALIPAAAILGIALACGQLEIARDAAWRVVQDVLWIISTGFLIFAIKQARVHRRAPLV